MDKSNSLPKARQLNGSSAPPALPLPPPPPPAPSKKGDSTFTPNLVAKSPPSDKYHPLTSTLKTRCSDVTNGSGGGGGGTANVRDANQLLVFGGIQMMCGLLMGVFGVLTLLHDAAMAELGGGLWSGAVAMSTGMVAVMTGLKSCYDPVDSVSTMGVTTYLAMCLVTIAVSNLALVLTSTGLVRDSQRPNYYAPISDDATNWAPILANLGLLLATGLLCLTTVVAVFRVYRLVCPCVRNSDRRLLGADSPASSCSSSSKQRLVSHWLGQQSAAFHTPPTPHNIIVYPPPLIMEGPQQIYAVPAPSSLGYSPHIAAMHANAYHQRRRSAQHRPAHTDNRANRDNSTWEDTKQRRRRESHKKTEERERVEKPKEMTEEELDKTYTGLDREIAEEFISIAMHPKQGGIVGHVAPEKPNRVVGCITNME